MPAGRTPRTLVVLAVLVAAPAAWAAQADCSEATIRANAPADALPMLDRAYDWIHRAVPYCQCVSGAGGAYRTDCSGFVSMVWNLPPPGHTTYSFAGGPWDDGSSIVIAKGDLKIGDAYNYPGSPSAGTGHVVLFGGWLDNAQTTFCSLEESHSGTPARVIVRTVDPAYLPIRLASRQGCGPAHCDGSRVVDSCGSGDCAAFGSRCVQDGLGTRCAFALCPDTGESDICLPDGRLAHCSNGALSGGGDCGAFGARCVQDSLGGRCVFAFCPATGTADVCWGSHIGHCVDGQLTSQGDCAAYGQHCLAKGTTARCGSEVCPPTGTHDVCADGTHVVHCVNGAAGAPGDCSAYAAFCSTLVGGEARCVSDFCVKDSSTVPVAHDGCWLEGGKLLHCDAQGGPSTSACAAGEACTVAGGAPHCAPKLCPDTGEAVVCASHSEVGHCYGGSIVSVDDCAGEDGVCSTAGGTPRCAAPICVGTSSASPVAHDVCLPDGRVGRCDDQGRLAQETSCATGQTCAATAGAVSCTDLPTAAPDAGTDSAGAGENARGCGCSGTDTAVPASLLVVLGALLLGKRQGAQDLRAPSRPA